MANVITIYQPTAVGRGPLPGQGMRGGAFSRDVCAASSGCFRPTATHADRAGCRAAAAMVSPPLASLARSWYRANAVEWRDKGVGGRR